MDHYKVLKTLGTGNFAQVKLALHLHTQVQVALKTLEKDKKNAALIENELEIMKFLDHPNIIKLFHVMETTDHIYMVLEYASGGDLAGRILEVDYMREGEARHIFTQMVCAVNYCHENGIAHRDIKPENILMDANRNIRLCDFGLAIQVSTEQKSTVFCGTLPYCAPELFSSQGYDPRALDIWSMGVVLYIMVTKHYPFKATTYEKMKEEMQEPHYYIPPKVPGHIANLIVKLFTIDPGRRPKVGDIMQHQWLKGSEELFKLTQSLETHPNNPNPSIMAAMWGMGYNPKDIRDSLQEKKFNSIMATYLILKHQSHWGDNDKHNAKLMQPDVATAPADPPTFHLVLKRIGSEPDHHTSPLPAKCQSHDDEKLVRKEDSENHSVATTLCCQQKSLPHPTGAQCGPLQHEHEPLLSSSLQKKNMASKSGSCGPVQHAREQLLSSSLKKRSMASKSVSCGPMQHAHQQLLGSSPQKRSMASKSVSHGSAQHEEQPLSSSPQKRSMASKSVSCGPMQHARQQLLGSSLQKRSIVSKSVSCGPMQHAHQQLLGSSPQKRNMASKGVPCGSMLFLGMASKGVPCGPVQNDEQLLDSSPQKRNMVSKSVSCGPMQHDVQLLGMASKSVSCGPVQNDEQLLGILSENHFLQVEPQSENPPKSSSSLQDTPSIRSSTTDTHHEDRNFSPQETSEPNLPSAQPQRVTTASPPNLWGGWKRVKRRIVTCLRRLCCCLPVQRGSRTSQRRVAPQE